MTAYDYKTQKTITGEPARLLRISQLKEEMEILASPNGGNYLKFTGSRLTRTEAISACVQQLNFLDAPSGNSYSFRAS